MPIFCYNWPKCLPSIFNWRTCCVGQPSATHKWTEQMQCSWRLSIRYHVSSTPYSGKSQQISIFSYPTSNLHATIHHQIITSLATKIVFIIIEKEQPKITWQLQCKTFLKLKKLFRYLPFVEPSPIWHCNLELQFMS